MLNSFVKILVFLQFLCGYHVEFSKSYTVKFISITYTVLIFCFTFIGVYTRPLSNEIYIWSNFFCLVDFIVFTLLTLINKTNYVPQFFENLLKIDAKLQLKSSSFISRKLVLFFIVVVIAKVYYFRFYYANFTDLTNMIIMSNVSWFLYKNGSFFNSLLRNIMFEITRQRMKVLRVSFEEKVNTNGVNTIDEINKMLDIYKNILDNMNSCGAIAKSYVSIHLNSFFLKLKAVNGHISVI